MQNQRKDPTRHYWLSLRIFSLFELIAFAACNIVPTLEPAYGFVKGASAIPRGQYLFVEYVSSVSCSDSSSCSCPAVAPIRSAYSYSSGKLRLSLLEDQELNTNWNAKDLASSNTVGFLGYGDYGSHIYSIASLPYESPDKQVVIYSVDSQGKIAASVFGTTYFFKPGQSWVESTEGQLNLSPDCHYAYTDRVTNYGFLTQDQIENDHER